jgi:ribose transport system substrate-binding protein
MTSRHLRVASAALACVVVPFAVWGSGATASVHSAASSNWNPASLAKANALIAPYTGHPSQFTVTTPLKKKLPAGSTIDFMDCGTPVCALFKSLVTPAAKAMGVKLNVVQAGATASSVNAAFDTVAQTHPAAVINTALDPIEWQQALKTLKAEKIPITNTGVVDGAKYGLTTYPNSVMFGARVSTLTGKLQAAWVYVHLGKKANVEYNWVPELSFAPLVRDGFINELKALCPTCKVHALSIPVTDLGTTAPNLIVSDLQANPSTNTVAGSNSEQLLGLPAALKSAGISNITTVGTGATPVNLQYLKAGQQTVDLALDLPVLSWTLVDAAVRAATGQPIPAFEDKGLPPLEFLTGKDITFNPANGWTGYPDFATRFGKLWGAAK